MQDIARPPINAVLPELQATLTNHRNVVLSALPGAGKTTRVPLALRHEPWLAGQRIIMLEPRRLAARASASYMASMLQEQVGQTVGYRTRMDTRIGPTTCIEVVTEGILTRLLQSDSSLEQYKLVIFDEFHERSLHADLGLALCLQTQEVLRDDLRILVMSATLDCEAVSKLLKQAPIITCEGKTFPVETHYIPHTQTSKIEPAIVRTIQSALKEKAGNILVFLPGVGEIRYVQSLLDKAQLGTDIMVAPLYGNLSQKDQDQAIRSPQHGMRKIVLATSIAETSLTIEGVRVVIDSGLMRVPRFDPQSGMTRLSTVKVSHDSATQRRGRAGRLEPGSCYRLWSAVEQQRLLQRTSPEILGADLAPLALELAAWGITDPRSLSWLDPPPPGALRHAQDLLSKIGTLDDNKRITIHGQKVTALPLHPRLAHMLVKAQELGEGQLGCEIAAILNERDFLKMPIRERSADLQIRVDLVQTPPHIHRETSMDQAIYQRVQKVVEQLKTLLPPSSQNTHPNFRNNLVGLLLAFAYPDRIAQRQNQQLGYYRLANGKSAVFKESESLATEEYIVIAELDGTKPHAHIFLAAPINLEELEEQCPDLFLKMDCVQWDEHQSSVYARREHRLGELIIDHYPLTETSSHLVISALIEGIRQKGLSCLPWTKDLRNWQARITYIRKTLGKGSDYPDASDQHLLETIESWLEPYLSGMSSLAEVKRMKLHIPLHALLNWKQQQTLEHHAPTHLVVPTGSRIALDYYSQDIPVLAVRLQEMFGQVETPKLAEGKGSVLLHLLSPARRPIQVTQDLASFWKNGYEEVKKELKGRYPKHSWPDNPLDAQPTRRTKPKH